MTSRQVSTPPGTGPRAESARAVTSDSDQFASREKRDLAIAAEALVYLVASSAIIAALPFTFVCRLAARRSRDATRSRLPPAELARRLRWALQAWSRRLPWRTLCFEQGLAAHLMLRRRGLPSVLYFGASPKTSSGLAAHVWVRVGELDVIGAEIASDFAVLAMFPPSQLEREDGADGSSGLPSSLALSRRLTSFGR